MGAWSLSSRGSLSRPLLLMDVGGAVLPALIFVLKPCHGVCRPEAREKQGRPHPSLRSGRSERRGLLSDVDLALVTALVLRWEDPAVVRNQAEGHGWLYPEGQAASPPQSPVAQLQACEPDPALALQRSPETDAVGDSVSSKTPRPLLTVRTPPADGSRTGRREVRLRLRRNAKGVQPHVPVWDMHPCPDGCTAAPGSQVVPGLSAEVMLCLKRRGPSTPTPGQHGDSGTNPALQHTSAQSALTQVLGPAGMAGLGGPWDAPSWQATRVSRACLASGGHHITT
ncbi:hypothetical protein TREES_T100011758 [Tupaia chinensis]|uniref:Uncharacterized protein n=1 Tax=Tupaia chinensis TaxID=246437 RepID=L9KY98_TUPCH|nr:hypothetical protein TREES_T100011758 [Tupaia chinensis]